MIYSFSSVFHKFWPKGTGIYCITNRVTNKRYIGSTGLSHKKPKKSKVRTTGFSLRLAGHRRQLRNGSHPNPYLQNSYNKHGESNFYFEILESCSDTNDILRKEREWIHKLGTLIHQNGYNISDPLAPFERVENERKIKLKSSGRKFASYEFIDPSGKIISGSNIRQLARELGLLATGLHSLKIGFLKSYKGYRALDPSLHKKKLEYRLISPEGELIVFDNIRQFARDLGVSFQSIQGLLSGKKKKIRGFTLPN